MKKFLSLFLSAVLVMSFAGCTNEGGFSSDKKPTEETKISDNIFINIKEHSEYEWNEDYRGIINSVTYPEIILDDADAEKYPSLSKALEATNKEQKEIQLESYESYSEIAENYVKTEYEHFSKLYNDQNAYVVRADKSTVGILYLNSSYSGGVHGYSYLFGKNYDTETGDVLKLSDVIKDMDSIPELVEEILYDNYLPETFLPELDMVSYFEEKIPYWILDNKGITFIFNPYDIASYAAGTQYAKISFEEYPDMFNEKYVSTAKSYAYEFYSPIKHHEDFDGDGEVDTLQIYFTKDDYESPIYDTQVISFNDVKTEEAVHSLQTNTTIIHTEDGKNYIYIECRGENAYSCINVYGFENGKIEKITEIDGGTIFYSQEDGTGIPVRMVMTTPDKLDLADRTDVLGTVFGSRVYSVDKDGIPVTNNDLYTLLEKRTLTLLQDIEADKINPKTGKKEGTKKLKESDEVVYIRTDNETFADLLLPDDTVVRVYVETDDWPKTINGTDIMEIFDGIMFAG